MAMQAAKSSSKKYLRGVTSAAHKMLQLGCAAEVAQEWWLQAGRAGTLVAGSQPDQALRPAV